MEREPTTYILASHRNGTLYTGVTSDLILRVWQHRQHLAPGFSDTYNVTRLVWYECHESMETAILREKQIKRWKRAWKIRMIESNNPYWNDLWPDITGTLAIENAGTPA